MFIVWGDWLTCGQQSVDTHTSEASVIITNDSVTRRIYVPGHGVYYSHWFRNEAELREHYWAASFLLPLGSIFILAMVVLLMVLFKRCPHMVAGVVAGLLGTIIVFVILVFINHTPIYS